MADVILDRELFFQQELNRFPAILHVDGEKKRIGYITFFALHIAYVLVLPVYSWLRGDSSQTILFYLYAMAFVYALVTFFRYYCIKNNFNTYLFISMAVGLFFPIRNMMLFDGGSVLDIVSLLITSLTTAWMILTVFIRGKCMNAACERYKVVSNMETEKNRRRTFDRRRKTEEKIPDLTPSFLDDEPNWNTKTVMRKPKRFCQKCGFGLLEGETECHVCGTKIDDMNN
ncbi:MAG: hypothetical protein K6G47_05930 [Clostridia bacterium]|nr:hypothetical protein [Clostridia bacterium]